MIGGDSSWLAVTTRMTATYIPMRVDTQIEDEVDVVRALHE